MRTAVLLLGLALTGCAQDVEPDAAPVPAPSTASTTPAATPAPAPEPPRRTGTVVVAADGPFGPMLYDAVGQPIYLFTAESGERPVCAGPCAADWPPVLTRGDPRARDGVRQGLLGTTRRADGSRQVTYAGHPLYFYAHEGRYEVTCHDVVEYGGTWLVVRPDGRAAV